MPTAHYPRLHRSDSFKNGIGEYGIQQPSNKVTGNRVHGYYKTRKKYSNEGLIQSSAKKSCGTSSSSEPVKNANIQHSSKKDTSSFLDGYYAKRRQQHANEGIVRSCTTKGYESSTSQPGKNASSLTQHSSQKDTDNFLDGYYARRRQQNSNEGIVRSCTTKGYESNTSQPGKNASSLTQHSSQKDTGYSWPDDYYSRSSTWQPKNASPASSSSQSQLCDEKPTVLSTSKEHLFHQARKTSLTSSLSSLYSSSSVLSSSSSFLAKTGKHEIKAKRDLEKLKETDCTFRPIVNCRNVTHYEPKRVSEFKWRELENVTEDEQREFLLKYFKEGKFEDVPVNSETNLKLGDDLFYHGSVLGKKYEHHFLCVGIHSNGIDVIEYNGPAFGSGGWSRSSTTSNPFVFAKIQRNYKTFQELQEIKARRRIWPKELERFDDFKVISRAEERMKNEGRWYDLFTNNCESFVNWCKCGLNISVQVKPGYKTTWEAVKAVGSGVFRGVKDYAMKEGATPLLIKAAANLSDDFIGLISSPLSPVGFAIGGLIEAGLLVKNIKEDYQKMQQDILTERQFKVNTVKNSAKAIGRTSCGIAGAFVGSAFGPVGTVVGGAIGAAVGHCAGAAVGWCYENNASKINRFVQEKVLSPVKRVLKSLFS